MKLVEIYGFVSWVGSFLVYLLFLIWTYVPEKILHSFGIYYYPDKSWALAISSVICMTLLFA